MSITIISTLSDTELESRLAGMARRERAATAELVLHLAEFDARRLYLGAGFSSLFAYCCDVLRLSESEAYNRIEVARAIRKFPRIVEMLRTGSLTLTTARWLAPHLTDENQAALLEHACGKRKREVEELLAAEFPKPPVPALIRKLPAQTPALIEGLGDHGADGTARPENVASVLAPVTPPRPVAANRRPIVTPLSADQFLVKFTASATTRAKLLRAQDLLRHAIPNGDVAEIVDRALTLLLKELERRKFAATDRPRGSRVAALGSRTVPSDVKRAVSARDGGQCAFIGKGGRRCNERAFVEFHHVDPYALDPTATASVDAISLRCQAHNKYEGTLYFGPWPGKEKQGVMTAD